MLGMTAFLCETVLCFLGFGPSILDAIFLRALRFVSARLGLAKFIEIDRLDQT